MELDLVGTDDPRREEVRQWLLAHPDPSAEELARAGWVAPGWPLPWGRGADQLSELIFHDEFERAGVKFPDNPIGIGWAGPTILAGGTAEQQARYLPSILDGSAYWCQLFSEPEAGSDLASLRTRAVRDGDSYVINGQKVWSTWAERSAYGILLVRTDPEAPKHQGISYFVLPLDTPGVTVRPIREMTGETHFNETFLEDVRLPLDHRIGAENAGWALAKITLANERLNLTRGGVCWGIGPTAADLFDLIRERGGIADPLMIQRAAELYIESQIVETLDTRMVAALVAGEDVGPEASIKKTFADEFGQRLMELAKDLAGTGGLLDDVGPLGAPVGRWHWGFLFSRALTVGGGTSQIQRSIIAKRVLGLPA
ncbi:MAG TPA: acyl-CoA dehydrogenase family protein [Jatrophihabitantaceae bacterium]|jgi:alkylation response protein AidB-like acyl-CoA dehydrogenase|nr:acyl-CoA dehydrogenase family protein [Jatrophihabitantaceae bacterium]